MFLAQNIGVIILVYYGIGLLFGIYFLLKGANNVDPLLAGSKKKVRFLLVFGIIATWPFFIRKMFQSTKKQL